MLNKYLNRIVVGSVIFSVLIVGFVFWFLNNNTHEQESVGADINSADIFEISQDASRLDSLLRSAGPEKVMEKLLADSGNGYELDCHNPAHEIGRASYHIYKASAFGKGNSACHSGFYHGAMEGLLIEEGTVNISGTVEKICNDFKTSFGIFECLHGVGHGVMAYENYNLEKSLGLCGELSNGFSQRSCYSGAFMENVVAGLGQGALDGHDTEWLNEDPHFPCNSMAQDIATQEECYKMQTSWMLYLNNYNFKETGENCLTAPDEYVDTCFLSLGRDAAGQTLRDPQKINEICLNAAHSDVQYLSCISGGLNVIVDFFGDGLEGQASELCKIMDIKHKEQCYISLAGRASGIFTQRARVDAVCATFEEEYRDLCK